MEIQLLPVSSVYPSPMNPRKTISEEDLKELADNIERQGLIQPITVRPIKSSLDFMQKAQVGVPIDGRPIYEIICGERRFRAFKALNEKWSGMDDVAPKGHTFNRFSQIAAIVRDMDDEEAFDAMITENLQRKDVDPIEEAFAFGQLAKTGKTAEEIAARFGKSVRFVTERIKLNTLIPELMLAVREERMPIVAAQIICKLDADMQKKFFDQNERYGEFTKPMAERFTDDLFMTIGKAVWNASEEFADKDYSGGCGVRCSECEFNTANHGCLFWEMKCKDDGRCTNRERFNSKAKAFLFDKLEELKDSFVVKGAPLDYGKTVIGINVYDYEREAGKAVKRGLAKDIESLGYEVVNPGEVFDYKSKYDSNDERNVALAASGEVYRVLSLFDWDSLRLRTQYWYVKNSPMEEKEDGCKAEALPVEVSDILTKLKSKENSVSTSITVAATKAIDGCVPSKEPLTDDETVLMVSCMLVNNPHVCNKVGIPDAHYPDKIRDYVAGHTEIHAQVMHAWLHQHINDADPCRRMAEPLLDDLGRLHCPEEYTKAIKKTQSKHDNEVRKLTERLSQLGYGADGRKLTDSLPKTEKEPIEGYGELRAKYPDSLLLFRIGDFYECFDADAVKASKILGITLTGRDGHQLAGFPNHALDTYLPKFVKAGVRVAIDERQNGSKPKKK